MKKMQQLSNMKCKEKFCFISLLNWPSYSKKKQTVALQTKPNQTKPILMEWEVRLTAFETIQPKYLDVTCSLLKHETEYVTSPHSL